MDRLRTLILEHEDWLIDRIVRYAHQHEYTRYTSTLREAWRASIVGLSLPLIDALKEMGATGRPTGAPVEAAVAFGVEEARKHRSRGIDMGLFLGLMKLYRQTYFDLVEEKIPDRHDRHRLTEILLEMFDSIELGLVNEWMGVRETAELDRLRAKNRELANEKNKYLTVFESIAEPTILLDPDDRPLNINAAGGQLLLGETTPGVGYYGHPDTARLEQVVAEILAEAGQGGGEGDRIALDTTIGPRTFSISVQEMLDISSKFAGRVIILKDVTDFLAAIAAAEDANRAKSAFLTTVSHEIKTPINSIIGLTQLIDDGQLASEHRRHIEAIRTSGKLLSELVENILGLSRSEANALRRVDQDFDLCDLVEGLLPVVGADASARGVTTTLEIAPDLPCRVHGDAQKLRHVLVNLMSNALKFTVHGGVTLRLSRAPEGDGEELRVRFEVADTGVGLPAGETGWLFDPFTQYAHPGLDTTPRGTGLGLAICKRLVTFLGGTISARPNPDGGSTFAFDMPFMPVRVQPGPEVSDVGLSVLVVEDDPVNALVAEGYLGELGHMPTVVHNFAAALKALALARFDLVLTDNQLDGATGLELARYLRASADPRLAALPVIVVTAAIPEAAEAPAGTVQHFVEKPFERRDLSRAIRISMSRAEPAPEPDAGGGNAPAGQEDGATDVPLLETQVLNRMLTDLGVERCGRIVESYLTSAPRIARTLARGVSAGDLGAVCDAAHQLIGAASFLGLAAVSAKARALHGCCTAGDLRRARALQVELQAVSLKSSEALARHWRNATESYGLRV